MELITDSTINNHTIGLSSNTSSHKTSSGAFNESSTTTTTASSIARVTTNSNKTSNTVSIIAGAGISSTIASGSIARVTTNSNTPSSIVGPISNSVITHGQTATTSCFAGTISNSIGQIITGGQTAIGLKGSSTSTSTTNTTTTTTTSTSTTSTSTSSTSTNTTNKTTNTITNTPTNTITHTATNTTTNTASKRERATSSNQNLVDTDRQLVVQSFSSNKTRTRPNSMAIRIFGFFVKIYNFYKSHTIACYVGVYLVMLLLHYFFNLPFVGKSLPFLEGSLKKSIGDLFKSYLLVQLGIPLQIVSWFLKNYDREYNRLINFIHISLTQIVKSIPHVFG